MPSLKHHGQMSEAFITALFLSVSHRIYENLGGRTVEVRTQTW